MWPTKANDTYFLALYRDDLQDPRWEGEPRAAQGSSSACHVFLAPISCMVSLQVLPCLGICAAGLLSPGSATEARAGPK